MNVTKQISNKQIPNKQIPKMLTPSSAPAVVVADIGGTHARIALAGLPVAGDIGNTIALQAFEAMQCADFSSLPALIQHYQALHPPATSLPWVLAVAAPIVQGDVVAQANLPWPVGHGDLRAYFPMLRMNLLNDFVALAHAVPLIQAQQLTQLCGPILPITSLGPVLVIGPGTGLGAAIYLPGSPSRVLASEAGHAALAACTDLEIELLRQLKRRWSHVDVERILSGPGLLNCYQALCEIEAQVPKYQRPAELARAAMQGEDALAQRCLSIFCAWMGSVVADLSIVVGAQRVILAGGISSQILGFLSASDFAARFVDKGVMREVMATIPVQVIDHGQWALFGAAQWYTENKFDVQPR